MPSATTSPLLNSRVATRRWSPLKHQRRVASRLIATACVGLLSIHASAQQIDLAAAPPRAAVQLTIYNAVDLTLVRERRVLTFSPGMNTLEFSWANTLIDPTSVRIECLTHADEVTLVDTVYPHDRPHELNWHLDSEHTGEVLVQVSYFTSGISWAADYAVTASEDEATAHVQGYVTVTNHSGEDYDDAQVRLVVGKLRLVEAIHFLANHNWGLVDRLGRSGGRRDGFDRAQLGMEIEELSDAMEAPMPIDPSAAPGAGFGGGGGSNLFAADENKAPEIVREGLSEYFIFTVEGTHDTPTGWSRRLLAVDADDAPLTVQHRFRPRQYGHQLVKTYAIDNTIDPDQDDTRGLGQSPLPDGTVRVFRERPTPAGLSLSYLAADHTPYVAITDALELNLGPDPDVGFTLHHEALRRFDIWAEVDNNVLRRLDGDDDERVVEDSGNIVGYTETLTARREIRNDTPRAINVEVRRAIPGDATWTSATPTELYDLHTALYTVTVPPRGRLDVRHAVTTRLGRNAEDNQLTIEQADVAPPAWHE